MSVLPKTTLSSRFGLAVVLSVFALAGCGGSGKAAKSAADVSGAGEGHAEVGKAAPDLSIQTLNGKGKISLESLQGKVVVVDFWATWCKPCQASFPKLEELSKKAGDKVEVIGISVDDEKNGILEFAKENGATFAIGWDDNHTIAGKWNVGKMPTTFIVDATGKVRYIHDGYHDGETKLMEKELALLVDEDSSSTRVAKSDKSETKEEPKKEESKSDTSEKTASTTTSSAETEEAPPPPKKKAPKKGGRAGGKTKPLKKGAAKKKGG